MRDLLQAAIPALLTALVAGQVAITRTGRLRSTIRANVQLLGTLPADDPTRATLAAHIGELLDTLVRREQGQFEPMTWIGAWIGLWAVSAGIGLVGATLMAMDPLTRTARAWGLGFYGVLVLGSAGSAIAGFARWRRERDLDDDQEPDLDDDQATAPA